MKKLVLFFILLFVNLSVYAQMKAGVLVGKNELEVRKYFQDLINRSNHSSTLKVEQDVSDEGNLILTLGLPMADEERLGCLMIAARFIRVNKEEICQFQLVSGSTKSAQPNLTFIKDNFEPAGSGIWKKIVYDGEFRIDAKFDRKDSKYSIIYELTPVGELND